MPVNQGGPDDEPMVRLEAACARAEREFPLLAAPDGTVAVQFTDLRTLLRTIDELERKLGVRTAALGDAEMMLVRAQQKRKMFGLQQTLDDIRAALSDSPIDVVAAITGSIDTDLGGGDA